MRMVSGPVGAFDRLISGLALLAGLLLCALTVLICVDVVARKLGIFTIAWTLDVAEYSLYVVTFIAAPWVLREGGHIAIDLFVQHLGPTARRRASRASNLVGALVCLILLYYATRVWWVSYSEQVQVYETFVFPEWWLMSVAPPMFAVLLVQFVRMALTPEWPPAADDASADGP